MPDIHLEAFLNHQQQITHWPEQAPAQRAVLEYLAAKFEPNVTYTEAQINLVLKQWHTFGDWTMLRRELIDHRLMGRAVDDSKYWLIVKPVDVYRVGGIILLRQHLLVVRPTGSDTFIEPGCVIGQGETPQQALIRELGQELAININEADLVPFGEFSDDEPGKHIHLQVFTVRQWTGDMHHSGNIEELRWLTSLLPTDLKLGTIFGLQVLPLLHEQGLIE